MNEMVTFLALLDELEVHYVSWKNNHEIKFALSGKSDLDVLLKPSAMTAVDAAARQLGWIEAVSPVIQIRGIRHFYRAAGNGVMFHLHAYFGAITGESWIKEFDLPLTDYLIKQRERDKSSGVWVLSSPAQRYIFVLRHLLKGASSVSRLLYHRERESYAAEWFECSSAGDWLPLDVPIAVPELQHGVNLATGNFELPKRMAAIRFRWSVRAHLRHPQLYLPILRLKSFFCRTLGKLFKRKKFVEGQGATIAITGIDGAGKSTIVKRLQTDLSNVFMVKAIHLGRPQGEHVTYLRERLRRCGTVRSRPSPANEPPSPKSASYTYAFFSIILAFLRLRIARLAATLSGRGYLVISDRWPTCFPGRMDGPRLAETSATRSRLKNLVMGLEQRIYQQIPAADLAVVLQVPKSDLLRRNEARDKPGKETNDELINRFKENREIAPISKKVIVYNNIGDENTAVLEIKRLIFSEIANRDC